MFDQERTYPAKMWQRHINNKEVLPYASRKELPAIQLK